MIQGTFGVTQGTFYLNLFDFHLVQLLRELVQVLLEAGHWPEILLLAIGDDQALQFVRQGPSQHLQQ
jgi:hypothetical protein